VVGSPRSLVEMHETIIWIGYSHTQLEKEKEKEKEKENFDWHQESQNILV
jgi:hypothetical protein